MALFSIPILWRYLLRCYLQVFCLSTLAFIATLLVMRFKDIAEFATLSGGASSIALFTLCQIPYILPNALPISAIIASMLLFQKMSHSQELTVLRAAGFSLKQILSPLLSAAVVLTLLNLTVVSEIAPLAKMKAKELSYKMTAANPFFIFSKIADGKLKNAYIDMRTLRSASKAKDVLLILNNETNGRLALLTAKELAIENNLLNGKDVAIISSIASKNPLSFDHLVIENQKTMTTEASNLSQLMKASDWSLSHEYLPLRLVLAKSLLKNHPVWREVELAKRLSVALTPFFFTLLGASLGMELGRNKNRKSILYATLLTAFYLVCYLGAKSFKHEPLAAWITYFAPYPLILLVSLHSLKKISQGVE